jgi:hypothetical protein
VWLPFLLQHSTVVNCISILNRSPLSNLTLSTLVVVRTMNKNFLNRLDSYRVATFLLQHSTVVNCISILNRSALSNLTLSTLVVVRTMNKNFLNRLDYFREDAHVMPGRKLQLQNRSQPPLSS